MIARRAVKIGPADPIDPRLPFAVAIQVLEDAQASLVPDAHPA